MIIDLGISTRIKSTVYLLDLSDNNWNELGALISPNAIQIHIPNENFEFLPVIQFRISILKFAINEIYIMFTRVSQNLHI